MGEIHNAQHSEDDGQPQREHRVKRAVHQAEHQLPKKQVKRICHRRSYACPRQLRATLRSLEMSWQPFVKNCVDLNQAAP
ncbi:hypothetical protein LP417_22660 [Polaromonas sp. P1-6]|nr:hypothetical protein LP417_22660 [Polaromonas sp. P1-6]